MYQLISLGQFTIGGGGILYEAVAVEPVSELAKKLMARETGEG